MQLSASCTVSWEFLTRLSDQPDRLFQPELSEAGGLGVDILTKLDSGQLSWEWYTVIRRLKILPDKIHSSFNGWYIVRRTDEEGIHDAVADLVPGSAWEIVPFATTSQQVESINQRRELISHPFNCIYICNFVTLSEENAHSVIHLISCSPVQYMRLRQL